MRLRHEWSQDPDFGESPSDGNVFLNRTMLHLEFSSVHWSRTFVELTIASANGRVLGPTPVDQDLTDIHQIFSDLEFSVGGAMFGLRSGRQEMAFGSGRLIDVREGPNVRQPFQGARMWWQRNAWRVDAFGAQPIATRTGTFDNRPEDGQWLWGVYGHHDFAASTQRIRTELYYIGYRNPNGRYDQGAGLEVRHSIGARFEAALGNFETDIEGIIQFGDFGEGQILAWTVATTSSYRVPDWLFAPRFSLSINAASGDRDPADPDLQTFNPLFPRGNYFGQLVIVGPANFFDVHPSVGLSLPYDIALTLDWEMFWRLSTEDAVYAIN
ncbi:MAG: alginate export family protein, partial [Myxococcota bacterium]